MEIKRTMVISAVLMCLLMPCFGYETRDDQNVLIDAPPASPSVLEPPEPGTEGFHRNRRAASCGVPSMLTSAQQAEAVSVHNLCRGKEPAADQLKQSWNDNLAAQAQAWAQQCKWQHGMCTDCDGNAAGQNLFMLYSNIGFPPVNITQAVIAWNDERNDWDFTSNSCKTNKVCGHWTQVVWSRSSLVGCGYALCPTVAMTSGPNISNAVIIACNYSPAGNYMGQLMYTPGPSCSACYTITRQSTTNRGFKCVNNLCVPCSPANDQACQCGPADTCNNGGTWDAVGCSCICAAGFFGSNCQTKCADVQPASSCTYWANLQYCLPTSPYYSYMKSNCVATCGLCG